MLDYYKCMWITLTGFIDVILLTGMIAMLAAPKLSAFREVGLNYFEGPTPSVTQPLLDYLLSKAVAPEKTVILHC